MAQTFSAIEYLQPAERGINRPIVLRGRAGDGSIETIFVKTRAGYQNRVGAAGVEFFTTRLAQVLGLRVPEPVLVEIPPGFEEVVFNAPEHRELVRQSHGMNFGTIALGTDWKTWPVQMPTRSFPKQTVHDILTFDALVQNTDREADNPNLLWCGSEIAILDHEKCFGNLAVADGPYAWRPFLGHRPLQRHCLRGAIDQSVRFSHRIHQEMIGVELENTMPELISEAMDFFPNAAVDLDRISAYFDALQGKFGDFEDYLKLSLEG